MRLESALLLDTWGVFDSYPRAGQWLVEIYDAFGTPYISSTTHKPGIWSTEPQLSAS